MLWYTSKTLLKVFGLVSLVAVIAIVVFLAWTFFKGSKTGPSEDIYPVERLYGKFKHAAVVTNAPPCASIGK